MSTEQSVKIIYSEDLTKEEAAILINKNPPKWNGQYNTKEMMLTDDIAQCLMDLPLSRPENPEHNDQCDEKYTLQSMIPTGIAPSMIPTGIAPSMISCYQIMLAGKKGKLIITPGSDIAYTVELAVVTFHTTSYNILAMSSNWIMIGRGSPVYKWEIITLSQRYISEVFMMRRRPNYHNVPIDITIMHAGFPDVRPAIVPLRDFVYFSPVIFITDANGVYFVTSRVSLTNEDVILFEKFLANSGAFIAVNPTILNICEDLRISTTSQHGR